MNRSLRVVAIALLAACGRDVAAPTAPMHRPTAPGDVHPAIIITPTPVSGFEGSPVTLAGTHTLDLSAGPITASWAFGDPLGSTATTTHTSQSYSTTFTYDDNQSFPYSAGVSLTDGNGTVASAAFDVTIQNVAPTATLTAPASVGANASFTISLDNPHDPSTADTQAGFSYAFDCGDGNGYGAPDASSSVSCTAPAAGALTVRGKIADKDFGETEYSAVVFVGSCTPPTITSLTLPAAPVPVGTAVTVTVAYTGVAAGASATFTWDDGVVTPGTAVSGGFTTTRTLSTADVYSVRATVTNACGSDVEDGTTFVVAYDPSAGFVTGGGWVMAPAGSYPADPSLSGKSTFGFVSKYQKGATLPSGNTEFQFHANGLNFHSTSYEWLVVTGSKARYKGEGGVQGRSGVYGFMLTAVDGPQPGGSGDSFRIKIWSKATGEVVFDNQLGADDETAIGQPLANGNISIKKN